MALGNDIRMLEFMIGFGCDCISKMLSDQVLKIVAQGLTWLLPERFSASEIWPEAGFVKLW